MRRTLVIHPGALGDVLLAGPALRALKAAEPAGTVVVAAQPRIGALLELLGLVDGHVSFDALGLGALFVDDDGPTRIPTLAAAGRVVCWFGARDPVFVRRLAHVAPGAIVASAAGPGTGRVWEHLLRTVDGPPGDWRGAVGVPPTARSDGEQMLRAAGWDGTTPLIMVHPGAGSRDKRWPLEGFVRVLAAVLERRPVGIVIHRGPADADVVTALTARLEGNAFALEEPSLPRLAGALRRVRAYLGNDSGVSHLAAAVGCPSVVLFEASRLAWQPWGSAARVRVVTRARLVPADVDAVTADVRALVD